MRLGNVRSGKGQEQGRRTCLAPWTHRERHWATWFVWTEGTASVVVGVSLGKASLSKC